MQTIPPSRHKFSVDDLTDLDDRIRLQSEQSNQSEQLQFVTKGVAPVHDTAMDILKSGQSLLQQEPIHRAIEDKQYLLNQQIITELLFKAALSSHQTTDAYDNLNRELRADDKKAIEDNEEFRRAINSISTAWNSLGVFRSDFNKNDNDKMARNAYVAIVEKAFLDYFGSLDWEVMDKDTGDRADRPYDFLTQPNPQDSFSDIIIPSTRDLFRYDAGAWVKTFNRKKELIELKSYLGTEFWIEMDRVPQIISVPANDNFTGIRGTNYAGDKGTGKEVMMQGWWSRGFAWRYWQRSQTGVYIPYTPSEVCYFARYKRSDNIYGTDYLKFLKYQVQLLIDSTVAAGKTFQNGLVPSMIIEHPSVYSIDQIQQRITQMRIDNTGPARFGSTMHLVNGEQAKMPSQTLHDMEWLEGQKFVAQLIWGFFGFTPDEFTGGDSNRACYTEDTEVLTENGWKLHKDVSPEERIAVYDKDKCECKLETPSELSSYDVDEDLVRFISNAQDFFVTSEHTILRRGSPCYKNSLWKVTKAKDEVGKSIAVKGAIESWIGEEKEVSDDYLSFLGWAISEGGLSSTTLKKKGYFMTLAQSNKRPKFVAEIKRVLKSLGFKSEGYQNLVDNTTRWNLNSKKIIGPLFDEIGAYCTEKKIPRKYLNLPREKLQKLFEALMAGDGSWDKRENRICGYYSTTSSQLADDFQELAFKLGYATKRNIHYLGRGNRVTCHRILVLKKLTRQITAPKYEHYSGKVYCFTTSTGFYITRRNGCVAIQGNTAYVKRNITKSRLLYPMMRYFEDKINREILPFLKGYKKSWRFHFIRELELDDKQKMAQTGAIRMGTISSGLQQGLPIRIAVKLANDEALNNHDIDEIEAAREEFLMQQQAVDGGMAGEGGDAGNSMDDLDQGRYGNGSEQYQPMNFSDYGQGGENTEQRFGNKEEVEYQKAYVPGKTFVENGRTYQIISANDKVAKAKVYVKNPQDVPEGRSYKQGPRGSVYYLTTLKQQTSHHKKRKPSTGGGGEADGGGDENEHSAPSGAPDIEGATGQVKVSGNGIGIVAGMVDGKLKVQKLSNKETEAFVKKVMECAGGDEKKFIGCLKKEAEREDLKVS